MAAPELDETDKAIIRVLQHDGRMPYSQLAPLVGLSQAAVRQRVNRLVERNAIQVVAVTDPVTLGLGQQAMIGIDAEGDLLAVAEALSDLDPVEYVVVVAGRYDILVEVVCRDADELLEVVNGSVRTVPGVVGAELMPYLRLVKQSYDWGTG